MFSWITGGKKGDNNHTFLNSVSDSDEDIGKKCLLKAEKFISGFLLYFRSLLFFNSEAPH